VSFTGAGTCLIDANQSGNLDYLAAPTARQRVSVRRVTLTVTPRHQSRPAGAANPTLTATLSGFINGDTAGGSTTGAPSCTTTATPASPPGTYPITCRLGSLASADYGFRFVGGTLTVT
jgi:hypothetical protein